MEILIVAAIVLVLLGVVAANKLKKDESGKIKDESVSLKVVKDELSAFTFNSTKGSTENSVNAQLNEFLNKRFTTNLKSSPVTSVKVDFYIGNKIVVLVEMVKTLDTSRVLGDITKLEGKGFKDKIIILLMEDKALSNSDDKISSLNLTIKNTTANYIVNSF